MVTLAESCTPSKEELTPNYEFRCLEPLCHATYTNFGNYSMHMTRVHKKQAPQLSQSKYHCPIEDCIYHALQERPKHFKGLKQIRQHYQKMHLKKTHLCELCKRGFYSTEQVAKHAKTCGKNYICKTCEWEFTSNASLRMHIKRKGHAIDNEAVVDKVSAISKSKVAIPALKSVKKNKPNFNPVNMSSVEITYAPKRNKGKKPELETSITPLKVGYQIILPGWTPFQPPVPIMPAPPLHHFKPENIECKRRGQDKNQNQQTQTENVFTAKPSVCVTSVQTDFLDFSLEPTDCDSPTNFADELGEIHSFLRDMETQTEMPPRPLPASSPRCLDKMLSQTSCAYTQTSNEILQELGFVDFQTQETQTLASTLDGDHPYARSPSFPQRNYGELSVSTETQTSFNRCLFPETDDSSYSTHSCDMLPDFFDS